MQAQPVELKPDDPCPNSGQGKLTVSPSSKHLVCLKCDRVVLVKPKRNITLKSQAGI